MRLGRLNIVSDKKLAEDTDRIMESTLSRLDHRMLHRMVEDIEWDTVGGEDHRVRRSDMPRRRREMMVEEAIQLWLRDPIVGDVVDLYTNFVFGKGMPKPRANFDKAQEIIDEFWNDPDNQLVFTSFEAQQQKSNELQLQGNVWFTVFVDENGSDHRVKLSDIPDNEIKEVIPHPENRKRHLFYQRKYRPVDYNYDTMAWQDGPERVEYYGDWKNYPIPVDDPTRGEINIPPVIQDARVFHLSINRLSDGRFGNPRVSRILKWAQAFTEFQTARVRIMQAAAWLAWRQKSIGDQSKVSRLATNTYNMSPGIDNGVPVPSPPQYAGIVHENQNTQLEFVKTDTGSANAKADGEMLKATIATGVGLSPHYVGNTDTNLATATSLELPVMKMSEAGQKYWIGVGTNIIDFVLANAIKHGKLPKPKTGKFSDIVVNENGVLKEAGNDTIRESFTNMDASFQKKMDAANITDETKLQDLSGDMLYSYELTLPNIVQRQLHETISSITGILTAFDPDGTNAEITRWAFEECLQTLNEDNPSEVLERVFPKGKPVHRPAIHSNTVESPTAGTKVPGGTPGMPYQSTQDKTGAPTQARNADQNAAANAAMHEAAQTSPELAQLIAQFQNENDHILSVFENTLIERINANVGSDQSS